MMDHAALAGRRVHFAPLPSAFVGGHQHHVQSFFDLRKEQPLPAFDPCQGRSVRKHYVWLAAENRHFPHGPRYGGAIGNKRVVGGEYWV